MALAPVLKTSFPPSVRVRGEEYIQSRRVRHISSEKSRENFHVQGSALYRVSIDYVRKINTVQVTCTCPNFEAGTLCKHLWAAALRSDQLKLFSALEDATEVYLALPQKKGGELARSLHDNDELSEKPAVEQKGRRLVNKESEQPVSWRKQIETALLKPPVVTSSQNDYRFQKVSIAPKNILYVFQPSETLSSGKVFLKFFVRDRLKNGLLSIPRHQEITRQHISCLEEKFDQDLLIRLLGKGEAVNSPFSVGNSQTRGTFAVYLENDIAERTLLDLTSANKLMITDRPYRSDRNDMRPYEMRDEDWNLELQLTKLSGSFYLRAGLFNGDSRRTLDQATGTIPSMVFFSDFCARSNLHSFTSWFDLFKRRHTLEIPESEIDAFLEMFLKISRAPQILLPKEIDFDDVSELKPEVHCKFKESVNASYLAVSVNFKYGEYFASYNLGSPYIYDVVNRKKIKRDLEFEKKSHDQLMQLQLSDSVPRALRSNEIAGYVHDSDFTAACELLFSYGWQVFFKQLPVRSGTDFKFQVQSAMDWFDLKADIQFGNSTVSLPNLLKQIKSGERFVQLADGSQGIVPEQWKSQLQSLTKIGELTDSGVRLNKIQYLFMSSLLAEIPGLENDKKLATLSQLLKTLESPPATQPAHSFTGTLRPYQAEGLAWLSVLSREQMGGILADDMGLGKTIQILALLSCESGRSKPKLPNLVVAPKSLVFNWAKESEKFLPKNKVLNYVGANRTGLFKEIQKNDLVITTYQTLRSDIEEFQKIKFNMVIFDEAHFIKNSASQTFKACRMIQAEKRFSLTGTPVENSVGDLLSLLSVTLPGLLSDSQKAQWSKVEDREKIQALSRAVSPFVLRRTKDNVLKDLPEKSEQVLYCELSAAERSKYDELKKFYWSSLSGKIAESGMGKSKIQVLEALLRLRQASCHFGLLDKKHKHTLSAKFELLLNHLQPVIDEGHKVLIFSQFTSLLELLKHQLNEKQIQFEYLDGKTKDRQAVVERFQKNSASRVFLLSLKAGGVGLNLTAADYVYILDPWWNPAAEAQAIDRTHRIGQVSKVFAYKIIAKDTIEEKILELQATKKALARDLVSNDSSLIKSMKLDDLKMLFE